MADGIGPSIPDAIPDAPVMPAAVPEVSLVAERNASSEIPTPGGGETGVRRPSIEATPLGIPARASLDLGAGTERQPSEGEAASSSFAFARTLGALGLVVVLIIALALVARRLARRGGLMAQLGAGGRAPSGVLEVLGRFPAGRGCTLVLLKLDRRVLLVCQTSGKGLMGAHAMTTLCEVTEPEQVASILVKTRDEQGESLARRFEAVLAGADERTGRDLGDELAVDVDETARPLRDVRDVRHVGPAQPMVARMVKPRVTDVQKQGVAANPVKATVVAARAGAKQSEVSSTPSIDRVRGRVAAMRGAKPASGWEARA